MTYDKVLLFLMLGGAQIASEGTFESVMLQWKYGRFTAKHIKTGEEFHINLATTLSVILVERSKVLTGPIKVVMPPEGGLN